MSVSSGYHAPSAVCSCGGAQCLKHWLRYYKPAVNAGAAIVSPPYTHTHESIHMDTHNPSSCSVSLDIFLCHANMWCKRNADWEKSFRFEVANAVKIPPAPLSSPLHLTPSHCESNCVMVFVLMTVGFWGCLLSMESVKSHGWWCKNNDFKELKDKTKQSSASGILCVW